MQDDEKKGLSKCTEQPHKAERHPWKSVALTLFYETRLQTSKSCHMCFEVGREDLSTRLCGDEYLSL